MKKPLIYLAPMSGVTNKAYRQIVKRFYADLVFPEFVSVDALHFDSVKTLEILNFDKCEHPIIAQLFGVKPEYFYEATKKIARLGFDGVDINFGCPAPKVAKNGGGATLLSDLGLCREIIQATLAGAEGKIPVSVKTRKSYQKTSVRDFCKKISDLPLAAICVHGRSFEKPYLGKADLECIREAKTLVPFLVMASGHAHTPEAAKETLDFTKCDGLALARGTFGRPWIGRQIKEYLTSGKYSEPDDGEKIKIMLEHAKLAGSSQFIEMRKVLAWYVKGLPNAAKYRNQLVRVNSLAQVEKIVQSILLNLPPACDCQK
ncbi:MAG: hypothetical protein A2458_02930 [Candidatus Kerfeldbacteria bacterium RIFOXYC2_FULL_38_9]|uniref:tRNA-dihydrouridine synthase n=1 Tax=Candidatus Kerfeldbacteria bacterium RIFOXYB2_FULL_38_14 TaxID=1798547 RepID=A0A1G2BIM5_9BACT|nr:MAG: hypothetical protein A2319_01770 [Candidatus Kerfeldbacteria bacterium RIFOXYB2_FULL_38_14]OGY88416.1 MAG: hypothetical protein A2458_02930 [Candidatus Kerfeldbacteria bacterium RIFOXYC2_FULL_38_9]